MSKGNYLIKALLAFVIILYLPLNVGCAHKANTDFKYLKNKPITLVETKFKRKPDNVEDWGDYKRYTWLVCRTTNKRITETYMVNNEINYRVKQEVDCCPVIFKADLNNKVVDYSNIENCSGYLN